MSLSRLEAVRPGPLTVKVDGEPIVLPLPVDLTAPEIVRAYETEGATLFFPAPPDSLTPNRARRALKLWIAHHDMPSMFQLDRLLWMVERYTDQVETDLLFHQYDLVELWQARAWRKIALLIDGLPLASKTMEAMHTDPEYAAQAAEARRAREKAIGKAPEEPGGPPLSEWTVEVATLTRLIDVVKENTTAVIASASTKRPAQPKPEPRPKTAHKEESAKERLTTHQSLAARVLSGGQ